MVCNSRLYLIFWPSNSPTFGHGTTTSRLLRFCDMLSSLSEQIISVLIQTQSHQPPLTPFLFCFARALVPCDGESLIRNISIFVLHALCCKVHLLPGLFLKQSQRIIIYLCIQMNTHKCILPIPSHLHKILLGLFHFRNCVFFLSQSLTLSDINTFLICSIL